MKYAEELLYYAGIFSKLGPKQFKIFEFIITNMHNNRLIMSCEEIAKELGVTRQTVHSTIKSLEADKILKREKGIISLVQTKQEIRGGRVR